MALVFLTRVLAISTRLLSCLGCRAKEAIRLLGIETKDSSPGMRRSEPLKGKQEDSFYFCSLFDFLDSTGRPRIKSSLVRRDGVIGEAEKQRPLAHGERILSNSAASIVSSFFPWRAM